MSSLDSTKVVYKHRSIDFGNRLTSMVPVAPQASIGIIYQGLYYDGSGYDGFEPRIVYISGADFINNWVEVDEPDEIPEGRA